MYVRLKELRDSLGLTQAEFGKSIGIAKSTYNNYETGVRDPKSDFWIAVAQKYGVTIDYLMGFSDTQKPAEKSKKSPSATEAALLDEREKELIQKYRCLDSIGQDAVDAVLDVEYRRHEARPQAVPAPAPVKKPYEMTDAELHAELDRQLSEQKQAEESQSVFGPGKSGTVAG